MPAQVKQGAARRRIAKPVGSTRLSSKNQVTIPVATLRDAGFRPGDLMQVVRAEPGLIELRRWQSRFIDVVGTLPGFESDVDVEASRDQWDR